MRDWVWQARPGEGRTRYAVMIHEYVGGRMASKLWENGFKTLGEWLQNLGRMASKPWENGFKTLGECTE